MSVDKLVDSTQLDSDLTSVANAIRAKSGGSSSLAFPAGFVSEIGNIPSGGGGEVTLHDYIVSTYDNPLFTSYRDDNLTSLRTYALAYNTSIKRLVLPGLTGSAGGASMRGNAYLTMVDLGSPTLIDGLAFNGDSRLNVLVIRGNSLCALSATTVFSNTPFASGKDGGTLYVPSGLISSYQSATNWSTILGYASNSIKSIESTHTDPTAPMDFTVYYADGSLIS